MRHWECSTKINGKPVSAVFQVREPSDYKNNLLPVLSLESALDDNDKPVSFEMPELEAFEYRCSEIYYEEMLDAVKF